MDEAPKNHCDEGTRMTRALLFPLSVAVLMIMGSCTQDGPRIHYGKAECANCRMNVVDQRFAAAIITKAGRLYVFDDAVCMVPFVIGGTVAEDQVAGWYVCDHAHPGALLDATKAFYVHGPAYRSPMRGDVAAFATAADRDQAQGHEGGEALDWEHAKLLLQK